MWSPATKVEEEREVLQRFYRNLLKRVLGSLLALENDDERCINRTVNSLVFYVYSLFDIGEL